MDVDDGNEYMNAAAAHAAGFVMIISAPSMYSARARHKYSLAPPTSRKIGLGRSADFLHSGTGYT